MGFPPHTRPPYGGGPPGGASSVVPPSGTPPGPPVFESSWYERPEQPGVEDSFFLYWDVLSLRMMTQYLPEWVPQTPVRLNNPWIDDLFPSCVGFKHLNRIWPRSNPTLGIIKHMSLLDLRAPCPWWTLSFTIPFFHKGIEPVGRDVYFYKIPFWNWTTIFARKTAILT